MKKERPEFSFAVRAEVRMPKEAEWTEIIGPCDKGDMCTKGYTPYGMCFRCQGKGERDWRDVCRNHYYDRVQLSKRVHTNLRKATQKPVVQDEEDLEVEDWAESDDLFDM